MKPPVEFFLLRQEGVKPSRNAAINHAVSWIILMLRFRHQGVTGCSTCDTRILGPVLHDEVWTGICLHHREILCQGCMEHRLGRALKADDLKPVPWNQYRTAFISIMRSYEKEVKGE